MENENNALDVLQQVFGFTQFRPLQDKIINSLIAGEDNFVLMPTGGGKSLCYQIPAIVRNGVGIIVSPLISLMTDQVNALQANGVAAAAYNSSITGKQRSELLRQLHAGELDLLYVAPERLVSDDFIMRLNELDIALFAIDEAHCISQWGPDFRPEYRQLQCLRDYFPHVPIIALTATADKPTRADIIKYLSLERANQHIASFDRPNIRYTVIEKSKHFDQLCEFLADKKDKAGIVYCLSRKRVDETAERLRQNGFDAAPYHAGMSVKDRKNTQEAFQRDDTLIIVATIAFGMGIDKPNVRFVVHYDLPKNIESYYQETGRAGRDNLPADALLLFGLGDVAISRSLIERSNDETQRRVESHKLNAMVDFADAQTCRRIILLNYFGEQMAQPCGNCDICINPPETYDATEDGRKALSCVYRVGQRYGVSHVIDVLRGAKSQKLLKIRHDQLSTYGIGAHHSKDVWHSIFRQLIHRGYIEQDIVNYSVLKLTSLAKPLLKGEQCFVIPKPRIKTEKIKSTNSKQKLTSMGAEQMDPELFEHLRILRKKIADDNDVPPFIIFSDATLHAIAAHKPNDDQHFLAINGVGQQKLKTYGKVFMESIKEYLNNS